MQQNILSFTLDSYSSKRLPLVMQGVSKRALQWYSKCYCVASVTKTFTLKGVQTIPRSTPLAVNVSTTLTAKFGIPLKSSFLETLWILLYFGLCTTSFEECKVNTSAICGNSTITGTAVISKCRMDNIFLKHFNPLFYNLNLVCMLHHPLIHPDCIHLIKLSERTAFLINIFFK
jgi:hypothetical protein